MHQIANCKCHLSIVTDLLGVGGKSTGIIIACVTIVSGKVSEHFNI